MKKILIFTFTGIILLAFVIKACNPCNDEHEEHKITPIICNIEGGNYNQSSSYKNWSADTVLIKYLGFDVFYKCSILQPIRVQYTLTSNQVKITKHTPKIPHRFKEDPNVLVPQAIYDDYKGSGWVRGHMARRQDMKWSEQAVQESDYYTNICPQNDMMNNGIWHHIENIARDIAEEYDSVNIVCGPIFIDTAYGFIGQSRIPIPDYFFKSFLIYNGNKYYSIAFLCPNNDSHVSVDDVKVTVNHIESIIHMDLYQHLDDDIEEDVENCSIFDWL